MSFKYWKKQLAIWASNGQVMGFLHLLIFCWYATFDRSSTNQMTFDWLSTNQTKQLVTHFFHPELEFFVLDFNVDHSKPMRLSFCHGLLTLQTQKPNNLPLWQSMTKYTYNIMPIYNKMPKYITNPNIRLLT